MLFSALNIVLLTSIFILLPSFVRDEMRVRRLKKQLKDLEEQLAARATVVTTVTEETTESSF